MAAASRIAALIAPSSIIQRNSPLLLTAEDSPPMVDADDGRGPAHVVGPRSGRVSPEDDAVSHFGLRDRRVVLTQPTPHRSRVLLAGLPRWLPYGVGSQGARPLEPSMRHGVDGPASVTAADMLDACESVIVGLRIGHIPS